jgi:flagellar hook-length control protein FliK
MSAETDSPAQLAKESPAPARTFTESLATRLRDGAADIVRSAQVVLRDGDAGIIRLRLEPESLGGVKIELKMAEKQISGKIVVESDIAGEAFRASLDALRDAFAESGFETTSLEVEVRNGMASGSGGGENGAGGDDGPYWSRSLRELDAAVPALASAGRDGLVDMTM